MPSTRSPAPTYRSCALLRDVSFDIHRGEFFGIVGRNGSGKSTLLKILASIYRADAGSIRMAGRLAPFIELGVGLQPRPDRARERRAQRRDDGPLPDGRPAGGSTAVLDFAELEEFVDLKLKNYSSGMLVRLAFSVMIQAEADILLIDEVLAVGDAAFQQKCARRLRRTCEDGGRTIVLVTHDMTAVQRYCHRAMLLDEGEAPLPRGPGGGGTAVPPDELREAQRSPLDGDREVVIVPDFLARVEEAWLEDANGERIDQRRGRASRSG